jgi:hypothetical protein
VIDLLTERILRTPPKSQQAVCLLAARQSIATIGRPPDGTSIRDIADALARGLFGPAFEAADAAQKETWIVMCQRAYSQALAST